MLSRIPTKSVVFGVIALLFVGCGTREYTYTSSYSPSSAPVSTQINNSANMHRATMRPYSVMGKTYYPTKVSIGDSFSGVASWYGDDFHGKKTSNGEYYNMYDMSAAHKTLPMNTMVKVTNLRNDRSAIVRINDRGPFVKSRIIDLSYTAAKRLDVVQHGTAPVRLEVVGFNGVIGEFSKEKSVVMDGYFVQIGAFRNKEGALNYVKTHSNVNGRYKAILKEHELDGKPLYRVWLSGFDSEEEARDFKDSGVFSGSFITRE